MQQATLRSLTTTPLIVDHEILTLPSASTLDALRTDQSFPRPGAKIVAVVADPVFSANDERVRQTASPETKPEMPQGVTDDRQREQAFHESGITLSRLPGTRLEANHILSLVPASKSKAALDFDASVTTLQSEEIRDYQILHLATHGFYNSAHPEYSGLVLSLVDCNGIRQPGFLMLSDLYHLKFSADLVVLSGCQTGLGKSINGEGMVGLSRGFIYAGARRVVVSLWSVSDNATAELMTLFYQALLIKKLPPTAALRAAQLALQKDKRWQSPYFWAAFTLQGEWR